MAGTIVYVVNGIHVPKETFDFYYSTHINSEVEHKFVGEEHQIILNIKDSM